MDQSAIIEHDAAAGTQRNAALIEGNTADTSKSTTSPVDKMKSVANAVPALFVVNPNLGLHTNADFRS
jgi:hypothetical protein